jgi:hypothetical protein
MRPARLKVLMARSEPGGAPWDLVLEIKVEMVASH